MADGTALALLAALMVGGKDGADLPPEATITVEVARECAEK